MSRPAVPGAGAHAAAALALAAALLTHAPAHAQTTQALTLDAVVRTTLEQSPTIAAGQLQVASQQGAVRQAQGAFDPSLAAGATTGRAQTPSFGEQGATVLNSASALSYRLELAQRFRGGISLAPTLEVTRTEAGTGSVPYSRAELGAQLVVPLMRGRGGTAAAVAERAAWRELDGSRADLAHRRGQAVLESVLAYWDYAAAARRLEVMREAEQRAATLLSETEALIRADARPAIDAVPLRAALASKRADVIAGNAALVAARRQLAGVMGVTPEQFMAMPAPSTPLPSIASAPVQADVLARQALERRPDLAAARSREEAARVLLQGAANDRRPQLDLRVSGGLSGLESGDALRPFLTPFSEGRSGSHLSVDLSYAMPVRNRAAEGAALQRDAAGRQAALSLAELTRAVTLDVLAAAETFRGAQAELELAAEAVRLHAQALEGERSKFRLGTGTLFDVLFAEDALTGATLGEIAARQRVAAALVRLRFQSGALSAAEGAPDPRLLTAWDAPSAR
ncbi:MAG TPA: TolC family protein [Longimicrobium sp.]|nr:TolC family protein [Longimicrobium sp.]